MQEQSCILAQSMPITKRAIKKLRHDRRRFPQNELMRKALKKRVKAARASPTPKTLSAAFAALDKAVKHHIVHKNKAARLKSRLAKILKKK